MVDNGRDTDDVGVGLGAIPGLLVRNGDHRALSFQLAVVPAVFRRVAEPAGQELKEITLRRSADAELEGLHAIAASVLAFEAKEEASDIERLLLVRIFEFWALDAELVLNFKSSGDVGAGGCEVSDLEASRFWLVEFCHDGISSGRNYRARASCRCFSVNLPSSEMRYIFCSSRYKRRIIKLFLWKSDYPILACSRKKHALRTEIDTTVKKPSAAWAPLHSFFVDSSADGV